MTNIFKNAIILDMFSKLKLKFRRIRFRTRIFWKGLAETLILQVVFFLFFFLFERTLRIPPFSFPPTLPGNINLIIAFSLLFLFFVILFFSLRELSPRDVAREKFKQAGIYKFARHPFYGAIVFLLNPAITILAKSWGMLIASFISYFFWKELVKGEEKKLVEKFNTEYSNYQIKVPRTFFPRIFETAYSRKKALFYILIAISSFFIVVLGFNLYVELSSRSVDFEEKIVPEENVILPLETEEKITPVPTQKSSPKRNYKKRIDKYAYKNGIISIPDADVKGAPIVFVKTTKYINFYHKFGIVHYPKTSVPGEGGAILLSGHSSAPLGSKSRYNKIFSKLNNLKGGDKVFINYEGKKYTYKVFRKKVVWPSQVKLRKYRGKETVTLLSCWPVGTSTKRIMVEAERIK